MEDLDIASNPDKYKGTISRILYELHYEKNKHMKSWEKHQEKYFLEVYGMERILIVGECIQHYFNYKDLDLSDVLPDMKATNEEKERFLKFVLDGFIESGFLDG